MSFDFAPGPPRDRVFSLAVLSSVCRRNLHGDSVKYCKFSSGSFNAGVKPNIELVAKTLNVSIATVSRALRDLPGVRPEIRAQVKETARSLGVLSRAQRKEVLTPAPERTSSIGILICVSPREQFPQAYLQGIGRICFQLGLTATLHLIPEADAELMLTPGRILPAIRDGLFSDVILIHRWPDAVIDVLSQRMHCVAIINRPASSAVDLVTVDHDGGMQVLVDHLLDLGHRELGYFGRSPDYRWSRQRALAFSGSLEHRGRDVDDVRIIAVPGGALIGAELDWGKGLERAVAQAKSGVTAWICPNGIAAVALIAALSAAGVRVPQDVSVVAFDGNDAPGLDLTSMDVPQATLGEMAVRLIRDRSSSASRQAVTLVAPCTEFRAGQTAAPPPRR